MNSLFGEALYILISRASPRLQLPMNFLNPNWRGNLTLFFFFFLFLPTQNICIIFNALLRYVWLEWKLKRWKIGKENRAGNCIFHYLVEERKQERQKIRKKIFPPGPFFFILLIWEENEKKKVLKVALCTYTLNLSCIFFLSSLFPGQQCPPPPFLGNDVASNVAPFFLLLFIFFSFFGQSHCQLSLFFSWALTLPLFFLFSFLIF